MDHGRWYRSASHVGAPAEGGLVSIRSEEAKRNRELARNSGADIWRWFARSTRIHSAQRDRSKMPLTLAIIASSVLAGKVSVAMGRP